MARKKLQLSNDDVGDDDSSDSSEKEAKEEEEEEEGEEEVSSEETSMNQLDTSEEKLQAKLAHDIIFGNDGGTTSPSSEPRTPESHQCSDEDSRDDDDDNDNKDDFRM
jgi:hypothetical protein